MKLRIFVILFILQLSVFAQLPKDIIHQHCYDIDGRPDYPMSILEIDESRFIAGTIKNVKGDNEDIFLLKTDINGNVIWKNIYGGSGNDMVYSLNIDNNGYFYIGGGGFSTDGDFQDCNHYGGYDAFIMKLDALGNIIWVNNYGGSRDEWGFTLNILDDGTIVGNGPTFSSDYDVDINYGYLDFWICKVDPNTGGIIQSKVFGSTEPDIIFTLIQTIDGGLFTAARACANTGLVNGNYHNSCDMWLLKLDEQLNIEWQKLIGGTKYDAGGLGLAQLEDGGYIINGITQSSDGDVHGFDFPDVPYQDDIWVVRIDSEGNILWDIALGGDDFENSSEVFANEDGSFTVFGRTTSMNNGDVEGNHYYVYNPTYPGYDIWMVHLSENGEFLDQRCFGNAARNLLNRGVEKISDSHYLIAGTGVSRQADPNEPEAPTDGEIWGGYTSTTNDIWFFEAVDCDYFQPSIPANIEGEDSVCTSTSSQNTYTTQIINPQYEEAQWLLEPTEAGELTNLQDSVIIEWNSTFEGQAALSVRSISNCGESAYTQAKLIQVEICLGLGEIAKKSLFTYPNPATSQITFELPNINKQNQIQIKDIYGKVIATLKIEPNQSKLIWECGGFASGVYFYEGEISGEVYRGKLVVQ